MRRGKFLRALVCAALVVAIVSPAPAAPAAPAPPPAPSPLPRGIPVPPAQPAPPSPPTAPAPAPTPGRVRDGAEAVFLGIQASKESSPHVDPALQPLADLLPMSKYNCFRVIVSDSRTILTGGDAGIALVEGYGLTLHIEKLTPDSAQVVLNWTRVEKDAKGKAQARPPTRIQLNIRRGKYFLTGGWQLQNGTLFALVAVK